MGAIPVAREASLRWRIAANTATVGLWTTAAKIAGGLKVVAMARMYGASTSMDAFLIAFVVPAFIAEVIAGAFTASLVPVLVRARTAEGEDRSRALCRKALSMCVALATAAACVAVFLGRWIVPIFGSSLAPEDLRLATHLFRLLLLWLPLSACIATWRAALNAAGLFALPAGAQIATPLITIGLLLASKTATVYLLCAGTLAGVAVESIVLALAVRALHYPVLPMRFRWDAEVAHIWRQYLPLTAGSMIAPVGLLIDQAVAGTLGGGSVSILSYGTKLVTVIAGIAATALSTAVLPTLSQLFARAEWGKLRHAMWGTCAAVVAASLPIAALLAYFSEPILRLVLQRGAFTAAMTIEVTNVQRFAVLQLLFAAPLAVFIKLASAIGETQVIARVAVVSIALNIALDFILARWFGTAGIPLATATVQFTAVCLSGYLLCRKAPGLRW